MEEQQEEEEEFEEQPAWHNSMADMDKFNLIDIDLFIAIRSEPGSNELFHLMKVEQKQIAEKSFQDSSAEHCVLEGEPYVVCKWFSFQKETKKFASFTPQSENTEKSVIHMGEVFSTELSLNDKNQMEISCYRMLVCNAN